MEQTERISLMEQRLRRATEAARALDAALDLYEAARPDVERLEQYYGSPEWWQDLADDQAGRLPDGLPRGVLSEDAIWDLLAEWRELRGRMKE